MRVKSKGLIAGAITVVIVCLLTVVVSVIPKDVAEVSAATSSSAVMTTNGKIENANGEILRDAPKDNYTVTMESSSASGTGTIDNNAVIDWTYVIFKVNVQSVDSHKSYSLEKDGVNIAGGDLSGKGSLTLYSGPLSDGDYVLTYVCTYTVKRVSQYLSARYRFRFTVDISAPTYELKSGSAMISSGANTAKDITYTASDPHFQRLYYKAPASSGYSSTTSKSYTVGATEKNSGWWYFYATDTLGQKSATVRVYLDCLPPVMTCADGVGFGTTVGQDIKVTAKDEVSTAKLYVKFESEAWFSAGESYTVPNTERNGRYYFYAEDGNGNRSETCWIVLSTDEPSGSFVKSDSDNSLSFVWNNEYWSATLDGNSYTEGKIISDEGQHEIVLSNNAYKTRKYTFTIAHYYTVTNRTEATCLENGIASYECSQCGDTYEETLYSIGHLYNVVSKPSSCTESQHIVYACSRCGDRYETEGNYPKGHSYVITIIKEPTCTKDGVRLSACEDCEYSYETKIAASGHNYAITETQAGKGKSIRVYTCGTCGDTYRQELGDQYAEVTNYVEYLFAQYSPYMWWTLLASTGVWSIVIGVMIAIARKNEDKEKAKKMLVNYVIGIVVIAVIVVACPFLIRGIAALIT